MKKNYLYHQTRATTLPSSNLYLFKNFSFNRYFVTTSRGFEGILQDELDEIFMRHSIKNHVWNGSAGCYFEGGFESCVLANFSVMCASRVLLVVAEDEIYQESDIYDIATKIDWPVLFSSNQSFSISSSVNESLLQNSMYLGLKIKDALCDVFKRKEGERPNVDSAHPDVKIFVRLVRNRLSISLDTTGDPLFMRGYRKASFEAPLKESLAASLLRISGWNRLCSQIWESSLPIFFEREGTDGKGKIPTHILLSPFFTDFMCGSGTLAIEAALSLLQWHPNARREYFAFMSLLPAHSNDIKHITRSVRHKVLEQEKSITDLLVQIHAYANKNNIELDDKILAPLRASDIDEAHVKLARDFADKAGVSKLIHFSVKDFSKTKPHASIGLLIINPPYGERLQEDDLQFLYKTIGDTWKQKYPHWTAWLLSSNADAIKHVGLRPTRKIPVFNANLECRFSQYVMYPREAKKIFNE